MRVSIFVELKEIDIPDGWLEWRLPVLPRTGEVFDGALLARAFDPSKVYSRLSDSLVARWDGHRNELRDKVCSDKIERICLSRLFIESAWLELEEIVWRYSDELGEYPELLFREREILHDSNS